jgi:hypothetical protein
MKAGIADPEKTSFTRQRLDKQVKMLSPLLGSGHHKN